VEASGCYGHNGADDAAADAALLSQAVGKPVRVQWMRHDEHGWDPKGPAMVMEVRGGLDAQGLVAAWDYHLWTPTHSTRPNGQAGTLLAGQLAGSPAARPSFGGGDRNARHSYTFAANRVTTHWLSTSALRPSALRGLGAPQNTFANESFLDELAAAAGADPVAFRLRHLRDPRAHAVVESAAKLARWQPRPSPRRDSGGAPLATGRGIAFAQYETAYAYVATVVEVEVNRSSGAVRVPRVFVAHDCGLIVNPDGLRNQIEGATIQTISRALKEEVTFDRAAVTSLDWSSYPILTFSEVPETIEIELIDRPTEAAFGAGEPAVCPVPAAIANAIFDATGSRLRTLPFTPERVKSAFG
jgi:nicotinate dehydrogenase subunit B